MDKSAEEVWFDFWCALVLGCVCLLSFGLVFGVGPLMPGGSALALLPLFTTLTAWSWMLVGMTLYVLIHEVGI